MLQTHEAYLQKGTPVTLTDGQWDLLRTIVSNHQLHSASEFYLVQNVEGWWINYSRGPGYRVVFPDLDGLRRRGLIRLARRHNCYRGWPTQSGISMVHGSVVPADAPVSYTVAGG